MIELEIYAAGVRNLEKFWSWIMNSRRCQGCGTRSIRNHDIVYLEFDEPTFTIHEIRGIFRKLGLEARIVGSIPPELNPKNKTQQIGIGPIAVRWLRTAPKNSTVQSASLRHGGMPLN